jgi:hypothetical protein
LKNIVVKTDMHALRRTELRRKTYNTREYIVENEEKREKLVHKYECKALRKCMNEFETTCSMSNKKA